jgi:hypothetical protein
MAAIPHKAFSIGSAVIVSHGEWVATVALSKLGGWLAGVVGSGRKTHNLFWSHALEGCNILGA